MGRAECRTELDAHILEISSRTSRPSESISFCVSCVFLQTSHEDNKQHDLTMHDFGHSRTFSSSKTLATARPSCTRKDGLYRMLDDPPDTHHKMVRSARRFRSSWTSHDGLLAAQPAVISPRWKVSRARVPNGGFTYHRSIKYRNQNMSFYQSLIALLVVFLCL